MELNFDKKDLVDNLDIGGMFAGKAKSLPILDCVKIKAYSDHVVFISSDVENTISKRMDVSNENVDDLSFCANFKDLYQYVRLAAGDNVKLTVSDSSVVVSHKRGKMELPTYDADSFPIPERESDEKDISMRSDLLSDWISDGKDFISTDSLRPILTQIYFYSDGKEIGACASDGHALYTNHIDMSMEKFEFTLGKGAFQAVFGLCKEVENVSIKVGERSVMFMGDGMTLISRMAEGRFPNFKRIIPSNNPIDAIVDRSDLISAIERCKLGANQNSMLAKVNIDGMDLDLSCQDIDYSKKTIEHLGVESNGNIVIGFKASLLGMILSKVSTPTALISLSEPSKPCLIKDNDPSSNKMMLLMPMMLMD